MCCGSVAVVAFVFGLGSKFLVVCTSRVMCFSCLVSDFVMGGCSFMFVSLVGGWAIGHIIWDSWWYSSMASTNIFAAMSI